MNLQSPTEHAESLASQILLISAHEVPVLMDVWSRELNDQIQVRLFAEYSVFLITYVDRLALGKFGEPKRSDFMNAVIDRVKRGFCNQRHFGKNESERGQFYEDLISTRLRDYASSRDMGSHIFAVARFLVENFCDHASEPRLPDLALETGKAMSKATVAAMATLPPFRALVER